MGMVSKAMVGEEKTRISEGLGCSYFHSITWRTELNILPHLTGLKLRETRKAPDHVEVRV